MSLKSGLHFSCQRHDFLRRCQLSRQLYQPVLPLTDLTAQREIQARVEQREIQNTPAPLQKSLDTLQGHIQQEENAGCQLIQS